MLLVVVVVVLVAGAACGEIWNDIRSGKRCNFQWNLLLASAKLACSPPILIPQRIAD